MTFFGGITLEEKNDWISVVIESHGICQWLWKKLAGKPSGPGALPSCIENRTFLISSFCGILIRAAFISSFILGVRASSTISKFRGSDEVCHCYIQSSPGLFV